MTPPLSQERLAEIRAAEQAATEGPWEPTVVSGDVQCYRDPGSRLRLNTNKSWAVGPLPSRSGLQAHHDAIFIALARTAVPELLAEVERLEEAAILQGSWEHLANAEQSARVAAEARVAELEKRHLDAKLLAQEIIGQKEACLAAAEARVAELEALISEHEWEAEEYDTIVGRRISICPVCNGYGGHHTHGLNQPCPWGQAAANHRARQAEVGNA